MLPFLERKAKALSITIGLAGADNWSQEQSLQRRMPKLSATASKLTMLFYR